MKNFIKNLIVFFAGVIICYFTITYNLEIKTIAKTEVGELLTISIFGNSWNYYNEF